MENIQQILPPECQIGDYHAWFCAVTIYIAYLLLNLLQKWEPQQKITRKYLYIIDVFIVHTAWRGYVHKWCE